ncbi:hypothetical protein IJJ05_00240 [Candidatus Saccharibacteria bacterium]|nr:hypothetical protein [Candidatus Saccharibacteria bacterium]
MDKMKNKFRQIRYWMKHDLFTVSNIVLVLAILLCLVWTYQSIVAMSRNWELSERLTAEKKELELLNIEVEAAELENEYYRSEEYQELMARRYLDKKLEGESMVVMPDNTEEAKNKYQEVEYEITEKKYSNFQKWMMYLFPSY